MKKLDLTFSFLLLPIDLVAICLAFLAAYYLRVSIEIPQTTVYAWPFWQYARFVLMFLPVWVLVYALEGLYNIQRPKKGLELISSVFIASAAALSIMVLWMFFSRFWFFSRLILVYAFVFTFLIVNIMRHLLKFIHQFLYRKGYGLKKVIVLGGGDLAKNLAHEIKNKPGLGFRLVKFVDREGIDKLSQIRSKHDFDGIILADPGLGEKEAAKVLKFCENHKLAFKMVPNIFRYKTSNVEINGLATYPMFEFKATSLDGWGKVVKRMTDILFSLLGLLVLSPLFLMVAIIVKIDSKGSVFFLHKRIGFHDQPFYLCKFRSMVENAPSMYQKLAQKQHKSIFFTKIMHDPRITRFGRFIRATCIDELPQLLNVLKGQMSLVGPRPLTPDEFKQVSDFDRQYLSTSYIKPGMTGLWQISGRTKLSDAERSSLEIYYVKNWSLLSDLWIVLRTPLALLKNRGIY